MNVIYMHTHDTGRLIQPYGHPVPTPNLMRLAREGVLFRKAFCAAPTCSPSRAGLMTGRMPHANGVWGLTHRGFSLFGPERERHLAHLLARNGYETVLCGIQHESEDARELGYQKILDPQDYSMIDFKRDWERFDTENAERAAAYLRSRPSGPFFLAFGMFSTHRDFPRLAESPDMGYVMPPAQLCDNAENRHDMAEFVNSARIADNCVGTVLDALRDGGLEDDTLVVFTTDHGPPFPEMKSTLFDCGTGVTLIVRYRGNPMAGRVSDNLVSHLDVYPTLCELLDIEKPDGLHGVSLLPLLNGDEAVRDAVYSENNFHVTYNPMRSIRTERYKYIRRYSRYTRGMPSNFDGSPDRQRRIDAGFYDREQAPEQLYDLLLDPCEKDNIAARPEAAAVRKDLAERLDDWMRGTADPLLDGPLTPPAGCKLLYPDSRSNFDREYVADWTKLEDARS